MRIITKLNERRESSVFRPENTGFLSQSNVDIGRITEREKRCWNRNNYVRWPVTIRARWWENRNIFDETTTPITFGPQCKKSRPFLTEETFCYATQTLISCVVSSRLKVHIVHPISCRLWVQSSEIPLPAACIQVRAIFIEKGIVTPISLISRCSHELGFV